MTKILRVGDPHIQIKNLEDSRKLMDFVIQTAKERDIPTIEFLGDLFHTHAVIRVEVIDFWQKTFDRISFEGLECRVLVGNHDQPGSKEKEQEMNALDVFKSDSTISGRVIMNKPMVLQGLSGKIGYIPYMSSEEDFFKAAHDLYEKGAINCLVAHQTFTGAQYENGFFSEDGIDPAKAPQTQIISGHIHKTQQVGKCFYPGTPKWDTMSDANQDKGIWIFEHDEHGFYRSSEFISTEHIVTPITSYEVKEGDELPELNPNARNYVVLEGKSAWITKTKKKFKDIANVKVKPTDRITRVEKENSETLEVYLDKEFEPISGVTKESLKEFVRTV
jgi:DNA repair exonuclease SbcCD nuclease subunit